MQSEFEFIKNLKKRYGLSRIGDDAAVLPKNDKTDLVISADMLVEDIDFRLDWSKPEFIGKKAMAISISDIAAMGGVPKYSMVSIGIPERLWRTDFIEKFYDGYLRIGQKFQKVELIGGDVSKTPDKVVIDSIVLGEVEKGRAILRSNARVGDLIYVTGELGGASAGLELLENGVRYDHDSTPSWQRTLLLQQLQPFPYNDSTRFIDIATSMIDISDGLSGDLMQICQASKVGAKLYAEKIPIHKKLKHLSSKNIKEFLSNKHDILDFALNGGEDYKLLFTANPKEVSVIETYFLKHIGEITDITDSIELVKEDGSVREIKAKGFQHF